MTGIFEKKYRVPAEDVNFMQHVDNQVYLRWMVDTAFEHSAANGWGVQEYINLGQGFVVKSHFIDYLAPAFENEELIFLTWISAMEGKRATRNYQFFKATDMSPLLRGETKWVFVDMQTGRPVEIPAQVNDSFSPVPVEEVQEYIQSF